MQYQDVCYTVATYTHIKIYFFKVIKRQILLHSGKPLLRLYSVGPNIMNIFVDMESSLFSSLIVFVIILNHKFS